MRVFESCDIDWNALSPEEQFRKAEPVAHAEIARLRAALATSEERVRIQAEMLAEMDGLRAALAEAERERDDYKQAANVEAGLRREFLARAERAEAALAAARSLIERARIIVQKTHYREWDDTARAFLERTATPETKMAPKDQ